MTPKVLRTAPVFRSFDEAKAREFYVDWLGFAWVGDHRHAPDLPLYAFLRLGDFHLHLSEHHGDATPGAKVMIHVDHLREWHGSLGIYVNMRPGLIAQRWGLEMTVLDPFGNRLCFLDQATDA